jgi:hypothetical protein
LSNRWGRYLPLGFKGLIHVNIYVFRILCWPALIYYYFSCERPPCQPATRVQDQEIKGCPSTQLLWYRPKYKVHVEGEEMFFMVSLTYSRYYIPRKGYGRTYVVYSKLNLFATLYPREWIEKDFSVSISIPSVIYLCRLSHSNLFS